MGHRSDVRGRRWLHRLAPPHLSSGLKVLIHACLTAGDGSGGVQTYLGALIHALGKLTDGGDHYLILGPAEGAEWLQALVGPNQTILKHRLARQAPLPRALGWGGRWLRRGLRPWLHSQRHRERLTRLLRRSATTAGVPVSNGYYEAFGASVVHFPFQQFIRTRLPSVYNPHDLQHRHLPEYFSAEGWVERELKYYYGCRHATRIAVATSWVAQDITAQYGVPKERIAVVPWGAATSTSHAPLPEEIEGVRQRYADGKPFLFYPAIAWPHKNHGRLIAALAELRRRGEDVRLVLSAGAPHMLGVIHDASAREGVADLITVAGYIPAHDLRALYAAAEAVVVPTLFEAASGPVCEAWLEGTPVACSDIPPLRAQAEGAARFFDPASPSAIADAIQDVLHDDPLRTRLIAAGSSLIRAKTWADTARGYRALYHEAVARSH